MARSNITDISPLMQRLFPKTAKAGGHLERYPARVFLCAYMVLSHPGVVFNTQGELEDMLAAAGNTMITAFEALLLQMSQPMQAIDRSITCTSCARLLQRASQWCACMHRICLHAVHSAMFAHHGSSLASSLCLACISLSSNV